MWQHFLRVQCSNRTGRQCRRSDSRWQRRLPRRGSAPSHELRVHLRSGYPGFCWKCPARRGLPASGGPPRRSRRSGNRFCGIQNPALWRAVPSVHFPGRSSLTSGFRVYSRYRSGRWRCWLWKCRSRRPPLFPQHKWRDCIWKVHVHRRFQRRRHQ